MYYMGHHRFLLENHKFHHSKKAFNGETKMSPPPKLRFGSKLADQMKELEVFLRKHLDF